MAPDSNSTDIIDRLKLSAREFRRSPFDGKALQTLVQGERALPKRANSLAPPFKGDENASITVAHFVSYANEYLPSYWFGVVPDIIEDYGDRIRYEHHDVPLQSPRATSYQLATLGRAVQDNYGDSTFWHWLDTLMEHGVNDMEEAYKLADQLNRQRTDQTQSGPLSTADKVNAELLREAVNDDRYERTLQTDYATLESRGLDLSDTEPTQQDVIGPGEDQALFAVFINGNPVRPSYDAISSGIESLKYGSV